jgi:hypothetical protein
MAEHLPECFLAETVIVSGVCICDRLRLARDRGYGEAMDDGWGEPGHIKVAVESEQDRIRKAVEGLKVIHVTWADPGDKWAHLTAVTSVDGILAVIDGEETP